MGVRKLLGIVASYRKVGNSEIVIKAVAQELGQDWQLSLVRLPKLKIYPCKGCYNCLLPGRKCELQDDVYWLLDRISEAEAVVFAAPNYVLGPVGIVKMLADRTLQAAAYSKSFQGKKAAVALISGGEELRGYADTVLSAQVWAIGLEVACLEIFYGMHPGEVAMAGNLSEKVRRMAESIEQGISPEVEKNRCPRCKSDLFRVHPEGLECAICKSIAKREGNTLRFFYFNQKFTAQGRREHLQLLLRKKDEYAKIKDQLNEIQYRYRQGEWIAPTGKG